MERIYLDNNAGTPLDPQSSNFLAQILLQLNGNPSSSHSFGQASRSLISKSRTSIASYLKVKSTELIFNSGGTECVNMVIRGLVDGKKPGHIITSMTEHSCVIATCKFLESRGHQVTYLPTGSWGAVKPEAVSQAIQSDTQLIALMAVNNETGVKTDIEAISKIAYDHRIPFFVDAIAQLGKEEIVIHQGVTAMAFSGHKIHALQGIGLLYLRSGTKLQPLIIGGEQEYSRRAGTENVLGIISMAKAIEMILPENFAKMQTMRDHFEARLKSEIPELLINGEGSRICNVSNLSFPGVDGEGLLMNLDRNGVAASHGSACSSGALEPSRILLAMGLPLTRVNSSIRFSLSRLTTVTEVESACRIIVNLMR